MTRKRNAETTINPEVEEAVSELFADNDDVGNIDYDGLEYAALGRLLEATTRMGGMVTFYNERNGNGLVLAVRIGERRKSYVFASEVEWNTLMPMIADPFYVAYGKYLSARNLKRSAPASPAKVTSGTRLPKGKK